MNPDSDFMKMFQRGNFDCTMRCTKDAKAVREALKPYASGCWFLDDMDEGACGLPEGAVVVRQMMRHVDASAFTIALSLLDNHAHQGVSP